MGLYRDESGQAFEMDDNFASARGYTPVDATEEQSIYAEHAAQAEHEGAGSAVRAGAAGLASGATLGLTDVLMGQGMPDFERESLLRDLDAHPIAHAGGEIAGTVIASMEGAPRTPTGYLSSIAQREVEAGLTKGGIKGIAKALGAMGAEGSIQSAGSYIGHSALENKEVTAEGLSGALGSGYAFGVGAGGIGLGVVKGSIAARKLYSRVMDGRMAMKDAESAWSKISEEALQSEQATARSLQDRLDEIQTAKREALKARNEARSATQEERIRASAMSEQAGPNGETSVSQTSSARPEDIGPQPLDANIDPVRGGGQTTIFQRPQAAEELVGPEALDAGIDPASGGAATQIRKAPAPDAPSAAAQGEATDLEKQLAGTKAQIDSGKALKEIPAGRNGSNEIEKMLADKAAADAGGPVREGTLADRLRGEVPKPRMSADEMVRGQLNAQEASAVKGPRPPEYGPTKRAPFSNVRSQLGKKLLPNTIADIRHARTAELLSPQLADTEAELREALDNLNAARDAMRRVDEALQSGEGITPEQLKSLRQDNPTNAGKPRDRAMTALDDAHEEALLNAKAAADPKEAGAWVQRAQEVEDLMMNLPPEQDIYWNLGDGIEVISKYEKAIARRGRRCRRRRAPGRAADRR
jgi:tetratricopeptide (TPR) repeat protein